MTSYTPAHWSDFALAQVGASAALLGLVFVGISINLRQFVDSRLLVNRAFEAIVMLASVLIISTAVLIPDQSRTALSIELIVLGTITGAVVLRLQAGMHADVVARGDRGPTRMSSIARRVLALGSAVLTILTGVFLISKTAGGLYWWPLAVVTAYLAALFDAWVLLVEILR
jgi:modulator of FtsH protease